MVIQVGTFVLVLLIYFMSSTYFHNLLLTLLTLIVSLGARPCIHLKTFTFKVLVLLSSTLFSLFNLAQHTEPEVALDSRA